jgi:hypothetical protein
VNDQSIRLQRTRSARVVEHRQGVTAYPEPYRTPVLPSCWAPLAPADESSVLLACDEFPEAVRLRLRSLWDASSEFRVYCLDSEAWRGICAATVFTVGKETRDADEEHLRGRNARLLAIAHTPEDAARVALDFLNWDLEADGSDWRLALTPAP